MASEYRFMLIAYMGDKWLPVAGFQTYTALKAHLSEWQYAATQVEVWQVK